MKRHDSNRHAAASFEDVIPVPLRFADATHVVVGRRRLVFFAGCDYFRLAGHAALVSAARQALRTGPVNVAASRMTTGNHPLYAKAERALARFFRSPAAVLTATGYVTNHVVTQSLAGEISHAVIDERAHPSLADASLFLGCGVQRFRHRCASDLGRRLKRLGAGSVPLVMTDGHCAHDGGVAPLAAYQKLMPRRGWILVDDSHGVGVLGESGGGAVELEGVRRDRVIQTASLSKGFGAYGGVVLGTQELAAGIALRSRLFSGNTPLPPPLAAAVVASAGLLRREGRRRERLQAHATHVKGVLQSVGLRLPETPSPVIALPPVDAAATARLRAGLLAAGIYPSHIRYPGAPAGGYFRFVLSSEHTRAQLDRLLGVLVPFVAGIDDDCFSR